MKPQKLFLNALALFMLCSSLQCKKEKTGIDALPPITQEGKNTFGCLVNGEVLVPKGGLLTIVNKISRSDDSFLISITHSKQYLKLNFSAVKEGDTQVCVNFLDAEQSCQYDTCFASDALKINRLDTINKIISGTFDFSLISHNSCSDLEFTHGRFDYKYD